VVALACGGIRGIISARWIVATWAWPLVPNRAVGTRVCEGPVSTTSAGAALSECLVLRNRRIEPNDGGGREAAVKGVTVLRRFPTHSGLSEPGRST
jgi:hypothetical protein